MVELRPALLPLVIVRFLGFYQSFSALFKLTLVYCKKNILRIFITFNRTFSQKPSVELLSDLSSKNSCSFSEQPVYFYPRDTESYNRSCFPLHVGCSKAQSPSSRLNVYNTSILALILPCGHSDWYGYLILLVLKAV